MKKYFTTLLDVFNRVISFTTSTQNAPITNSISALQQGIYNTLTNKVNAINALVYPQSEQVDGYATQKNMFKKAAANLAMIVINGAKAYAKASSRSERMATIATSDWRRNEPNRRREAKNKGISPISGGTRMPTHCQSICQMMPRRMPNLYQNHAFRLRLHLLKKIQKRRSH